MVKRVSLFVLASMLLALGAMAGGGGGKKSAEEPESEIGGGDPEPPPKQDVMIPEEKYVEIKAFFDRKSRIVANCYSDSVDAGDLEKTAKGYATVLLTITPDGKPINVRIGEASLKAKSLHSCIVSKVERWALPTLPAKLDYSYTFAFDPL